jgi:FkbH-like protein
MWGGIVGEVGAAGVSLDPNSDGAPYLQLQAFLKDLSERGVPLCVVSKNNYDDATSPFLEREEMILRLDDFVYFLAGWGSKADALQQVARDLGIGIDALCFLDDSPHERSEARALVPALIVPDLPEDSGQRVNALVRSGLFMQPVVGDEDRKRVKSYKARALSGGEAAAAGDFTAYLRSLNMTLRALPIDSTNLPRVTALLHKTNQFNVTTRRHTASQLASFAGNTVNYAFCYALSDRIEDAGIIGVILGCPEGDALRIDTWLMSCRVISRTVELAMFGHLLRWCEGRRIYRLLGEYIPTAKNALVAELFDRLGFERVANQQNTVIYEGREIPQPSHTIRIVDAAEDFVDGTNQGDAQ